VWSEIPILSLPTIVKAFKVTPQASTSLSTPHHTANPFTTPITMSVLRTAFARFPTARVALPALPSVQTRAFTSSISGLNKADDKLKAAYEKHRGEVEPSVAAIDESITFEQPKVGPFGWIWVET
jgi:hypothetical protein